MALGALGLWCSIPDTAPLASGNPASTAFIDLRRAEAVEAGRPFTLRWQWRPLAGISRYLRAAVIYAEDYNFYRHDGIDWRAVEHAITADWNTGAMSIGGSTITQQLAKNLYLSPRRSLVRKLREALIAFSLEDHLTKQRMLELYLNIVEWGDGVFGAEAAARAYFHRGANSLSPAQAVRLAIALPNPITRAPTVRDPDLTRKAVRLIRLLRMQGLLDAGAERAALDEVGAPGERVLPDREVAAARATAVEQALRADAVPSAAATEPTTVSPPEGEPPMRPPESGEASDEQPTPALPAPGPAAPAPMPAGEPAPAPAPSGEPAPAPAPSANLPAGNP
jgi:monofunctional biosynthetic peptidoglycan transglycosylase